jgi:hypothetical protein
MLEDYFAQEKERLEEDLRPELGYQVVSPRAREDTEGLGRWPRNDLPRSRSTPDCHHVSYASHHLLTSYLVLPPTYRAQPWKTPRNPLANP